MMRRLVDNISKVEGKDEVLLQIGHMYVNNEEFQSYKL